MKPFTNTAAGRKRLIRVCEVVREGLGLGSLAFDYVVVPDDDEQIAGCRIRYYGWSIEIRFNEVFFTNGLDDQLHTIVHEHLHAALHPLSQFIYKANRSLVASKHRREFKEQHRTADELTIDHLTAPIIKLLRPQIDKVI